ncbi:hypothetical protein [Bacillus subtilis]|uniref:hypothetical protein n=1 Tax=Bacillus subtilis TaxID=1423 RepID=UPI0015FF7DDB|nr:hypothetical protein [Bacillus subtilis]
MGLGIFNKMLLLYICESRIMQAIPSSFTATDERFFELLFLTYPQLVPSPMNQAL